MSLVKRNRLFFPTMDDFFSPDWLGGISNELNTLPAVNIKENEQNFELDLAIPGQKREDFNIELDENVLTISMEQKTEDESIVDSFTRKEFSYTSFRRSFTLPESVDEGKIDATYKEGILKVTLPKKDEALPKPKRLISIGK